MMKFLVTLSFLLLLLPATPSAAPASSSEAVGSALPPRVKSLLLREMNAILAASKTILEALVQGNDQTVAKEARAIHDSFIMKREMTPEDKKALRAAVPDNFLSRDQAFHELSARLADAAREGDRAGQEKLFNKLVTACTKCHAKHALDRFPGLAAVE
ncbi:MAG: cytochrome c [Desulfurivibrionaceae bacterium]